MLAAPACRCTPQVVIYFLVSAANSWAVPSVLWRLTETKVTGLVVDHRAPFLEVGSRSGQVGSQGRVPGMLSVGVSLWGRGTYKNKKRCRVGRGTRGRLYSFDAVSAGPVSCALCVLSLCLPAWALCLCGWLAAGFLCSLCAFCVLACLCAVLARLACLLVCVCSCVCSRCCAGRQSQTRGEDRAPLEQVV